MKTVFDPAIRAELVNRIGLLSDYKNAQWGTMNVKQMVKHCTLWEEMIHNNVKYPRPFIGHILGRVMLRKEMKDDRYMRKNNPTIPQLKVTTTPVDLAHEKQRWIEYLHAYDHYSHPDHSFTHPFFGRMTREQIGYHAYKHTDHHLRQFGC
jgi:hypothetical protein